MKRIAPCLPSFYALLVLALSWASIGSAWTPVPMTDFPSAMGVAAATYEGKVHLFATGADGQIRMDVYDGIAWSGWSPVPLCPVTDETPAATEHSGALYLFCKGPGGQILYNTYSPTPPSVLPSWHDWLPVTAPSLTDASVTAVSAGGTLYLAFHIGADLYYTTLEGTTWSRPDFFRDYTGAGAPTLAAKVSPLRLYLFAGRSTAGDHNLLRTLDLTSDEWQSWTVILPSLSLPPPTDTKVITAAAGMDTEVFFLAYDEADNRIYFNYTDGARIGPWAVDPSDARTSVRMAAVAYRGELYEFANLTGSGISWRNGIGWGPASAFALVNIIPDSQSNEQNSDASPDLAVRPGTAGGADQVLITCAQGGISNAFFSSPAGGLTWTPVQRVGSRDVSVQWSPGGTVYAALERDQVSRDEFDFDIRMRPFASPVSGSALPPGTPVASMPRFPSLDVANAGGLDLLYVGFSDESRSRDDFDDPRAGADGRTAYVRCSPDGGHTWGTDPADRRVAGGWPALRIDNRPDPMHQIKRDSQTVRVAAVPGGSRVYALFERYYFQPGTEPGYEVGDVVVVRDDAAGTHQFGDLLGLAGKNVANAHLASWREQNTCAIAVNPSHPDEVYVAYVERVGDMHLLRLQFSPDAGVNFSLLWSSAHEAALPALAVANNGMVGLLYKEITGAGTAHPGSTIHFLQGLAFLDPLDRILASAPDALMGGERIFTGGHQDLQAVGNTFFGVFSFNNHPDPSHFPNGVYYQRRVRSDVDDEVRSHAFLNTSGRLVDGSGVSRDASSDPFFFYEDASILRPLLWHKPEPNDPGHLRLGWSEKRRTFATMPAYVLEASATVGPNSSWAPVNASPLALNGEISVTVETSPKVPSMFFRLRQQAPDSNSTFSVTAFAGGDGMVEPSGTLLRHPSGGITFTARPGTNSALDKWYVDGVVVQAGGNTFTLAGIGEDHTVAAIFKSLDQPGSTNSAPTIIQQPENQTVGTGGTVTFSVAASGTAPVSYQWYRNNTLIAGATTKTLSINNAQPADAGVYFVQVVNQLGSVFSTGATLVVQR